MKTILVADDEDFLRLLIKETLDHCRVIEARSGDEALELARSERPDLVILDWMMPGVHGPDVLQALRRDAATRELPVLMVTAKLGDSERARLEDLGATDCLRKPFGTEELRERVDAILGAGS